MSTRTEKNQLLESIYEWQTSRQLKNWNVDQIRYEIGVTLIEHHASPVTLISEDKLVEIAFKENCENFTEEKYGKYTLKAETPGSYFISKTSTTKKEEVVEEEPEETGSEE